MEYKPPEERKPAVLNFKGNVKGSPFGVFSNVNLDTLKNNQSVDPSSAIELGGILDLGNLKARMSKILDQNNTMKYNVSGKLPITDNTSIKGIVGGTKADNFSDMYRNASFNYAPNKDFNISAYYKDYKNPFVENSNKGIKAESTLGNGSRIGIGYDDRDGLGAWMLNYNRKF